MDKKVITIGILGMLFLMNFNIVIANSESLKTRE